MRSIFFIFIFFTTFSQSSLARIEFTRISIHFCCCFHLRLRFPQSSTVYSVSTNYNAFWRVLLPLRVSSSSPLNSQYFFFFFLEMAQRHTSLYMLKPIACAHIIINGKRAPTAAAVFILDVVVCSFWQLASRISHLTFVWSQSLQCCMRCSRNT